MIAGIQWWMFLFLLSLFSYSGYCQQGRIYIPSSSPIPVSSPAGASLFYTAPASPPPPSPLPQAQRAATLGLFGNTYVTEVNPYNQESSQMSIDVPVKQSIGQSQQKYTDEEVQEDESRFIQNSVPPQQDENQTPEVVEEVNQQQYSDNYQSNGFEVLVDEYVSSTNVLTSSFIPTYSYDKDTDTNSNTETQIGQDNGETSSSQSQEQQYDYHDQRDFQCEKTSELLQRLNFTIFLQGLERWDLLEILDNEEFRFTIFVPSDSAFMNFLQANGITLDLFVRDELLDKVLTYHIVPNGEFMLQDLQEGMVLPTMLKQANLVVTRSEQYTFILSMLSGFDGLIVYPDAHTCNAVVHVLDGVLVPDFDDRGNLEIN
eukprot:TRINITY_DN9405_c0_g1_i3.p1 TRINITY_DN9405_c0_g1~~TRINITY_DN9405_c0_g1_i3.p1  ORF type:complete len:373 (-),score=35.66 TRINITY_DN9405_c0_g1_i3:239-1357(-)